ncbi:MAG: orotate phosphoribosyltransferase [Gemmatimonadota bacterium]
MTSKADLVRLLLARSVRHGDFILASGAHSSFYVDARLTTMSAEGLSLIGQLGLDVVFERAWEARGVGGLTMGADPVAYAIAGASLRTIGPMDAFSVRKVAKAHGTGKQIEGNFTSGDRVVIVEDVITTGSSAKTAIQAVLGAGGIIAGILAVVDREEGGRQALEDLGIEVVALTTATELGLK